MGVFRPDGGFRAHKLRHYTGEVRPVGRVLPGTVLVAITDMGANIKVLGRSARVPTSIGAEAVLSADVGKVEWLTDDETVRSYVYWVMRTEAFRNYCLRVARGTTVRRVHPDDVAAFRITGPHEEIVGEIVELLDSIEAKIEINRKMNTELRQMAQAIFKSWFIDFDGRGELIESELGMIPKGWSEGTISELAHLRIASLKPYESPDTLWEHFSIPAFDEGYWPAKEAGNTIKSTKYAVPSNAVLVSKLNPRFPRIWMTEPTHPSEAICSTEFMPFVPAGAAGRAFVYDLFNSRPVHEAMLARVTGSTGSRQRVKPREIASMPTAIPTDDALAQFDEVVGPMHARRLSALRESRTLARIRNTLLSELISGEFHMPETEKEVEGLE